MMEYIKNRDYEYIINKYHRQDQPFNPFVRFLRRDERFEQNSGLAPEEIFAGIREQDQSLTHLPHPIRKAKAFAYILENTRISCDPRDIFPSINMIDRPLNQTLIADWRREVFTEIIPEVEQKRAYFEKNGIATLWPDFDHSVPFWDRLFELGFSGILAESEATRATFDDLTEEQAAFFEGIRITYTAILAFIDRLSKQAECDGSPRMAQALANVRHQPPQTFYEALLVDYLYFMLSEHIEGLQVRSLCNFDRLFYRFYKKEEEEQIRRDLAYFFLQFTAIGNYWNQPVFLGGCKEDESTEINELSYLFLDVYDRMNIYNPKIQIKVADSTPQDFLLKAMDMIRRGNSSIVFVNDATLRSSLEKAGATPDQARLCNVRGCYEYSIQSAMDTSMNYVNLLKPLEYALHGGRGSAGCVSPEAEEYTDFESFYAQYKRQLQFLIDQVIDVVNAYEDYLAFINPQSMLSATYPSCLRRAQDALAGGGETNDTAMSIGFIADAADSLTAIKKYVFDKKELTLAEFRDILDADFKGHEAFRRRLLLDPDKYGNNKDLPDSFAVELADFTRKLIYERPNATKRNGRWMIEFHMARQSYTQAPHTASSPNGRLRGQELSKNLSASMGMNREGATAAILSTTKIPMRDHVGSGCLDLGLLPSAVKGEDGLLAMYALVRTFIRRGGQALQINAFNADTLRAAQREPEKYKDLQIRVCGWNVLFNNINKAEQDSFIKQAEALV